MLHLVLASNEGSVYGLVRSVTVFIVVSAELVKVVVTAPTVSNYGYVGSLVIP